MEVKPILGTGRELFVHHLAGDDFAVYYQLPLGVNSREFDFLERLAEDLRAQVLNVVNRSLTGILNEPIALHQGWAILKPTPDLSLESLVYNALKDALAMAKGHSDYKWARCVWELKEAIAAGNFSVYYQPMLSLEKGEVIGYEALCRGPVDSYFQSPAVIFPLAEKAGLLYLASVMKEMGEVSNLVSKPMKELSELTVIKPGQELSVAGIFELAGEISSSSTHLLQVTQFLAEQAKETAGIEEVIINENLTIS